MRARPPCRMCTAGGSRGSQMDNDVQGGVNRRAAEESRAAASSANSGRAAPTGAAHQQGGTLGEPSHGPRVIQGRVAQTEQVCGCLGTR